MTDTIANDILKETLIQEALTGAMQGGYIDRELDGPDLIRILSKLRTCLIVRVRKGVKTATLNLDSNGFKFNKTIILNA